MNNFTRRRTGQSLVEFSMVAPLFFLLMFGIIDFGRLFFTQMTLQHAVREAGRFGVTGKTTTDSHGLPLDRQASIIQKMLLAAAGLGLQPTQVVLTPANGGLGGEALTISCSYDLTLITPIIGQFFHDRDGNRGKYSFTVGVTFKNEPFG